MKRLWVSLICLAVCVSTSLAEDTDSTKTVPDVEYARIAGRVLMLDLHLPRSSRLSPLIVWVHGGAWRSGSKTDMPIKQLVEQGYAIASVDYRLSTEARFPAQIHDIKAAVRYLRAHGDEWKVAADKIVIAGNSAGGHLAALVGVSNGREELEGKVGEDSAQSSAVQGIISFYGASNLTTILSQSTPHGLRVRVPALELLLGGQPEDVPAIARLASPVFHVDQTDPPLLLLHGDQDAQMPINQSHELCGAYEAVKAPVQLKVIHGAAHGGAVFYNAEQLAVLREFLHRSF